MQKKQQNNTIAGIAISGRLAAEGRSPSEEPHIFSPSSSPTHGHTHAHPPPPATLEALSLPLALPDAAILAIDSTERYVAVAMELEGFYCPSGWLYVWDASTGAVVTEKDGTAWECSEGEKVTKVKLSPKGAVVALATTAGRVVVQSALRSVDRRLDGLALHHSAHTARITDVCWGYKGIYSCDEAGQIYEFHWKASFAPTLLADVNEPVLQISSRSFTGAYAEDCVLLVVVTARRCLLIDTDTGMVATVAGKGPQEGPVGACFTWGCGDLVVAFPSSVWIIAVTDLAMGVEVKNKVVCENGVQLLAPLRDGRVAGLCGGGVQLISPATGVVEEVACSGVVDAAFTHRGDVVLLLEDGVEWLSVGEKRGGRNAHKKYTNSHFASGAGRRTIPGKVACTAATAAALSIATALCPPYPLSPRKRSRQEAPRQQAPMQPTAFIAPENIEKAKQLSMGMITSASSMWSSVLRMAEEPIPYNVIVIIVASMSAVAVAVPIRRVRKHSRPRVIKTGKKVKEKEATIKDRVKKVHAVREAADLAPEQLVCVQDEEASLYEDRMRCLVDESQRRLLRDYETRVQTLKTESAEVASTTAAIAVVLASWGANPLQARHDEAIEIAVAAATVISVYGCFEMERRFVIRNTHQMCRELTELLLWNVDADIDDIERRAEREQQKQEQEAREHRAAEAREAELMLPAASLSVYRSYEGEEADELLNAVCHTFSARPAFLDAVFS